MYKWNDGTYISHHGILGQKWGVRRYQNPDGSLTAAGAKKYSKTFKENQKLEKKKNAYLAKSEKYERKAPSFYLTDFGLNRQRKYAGKAAAARGKASSIQKKIDKNNSKEYMKIGKEYLDSLKNKSLNSIKDYNDFVKQSAKKFIKERYQDSIFNDSYSYNKFVSELLEGNYGEKPSTKLQSLNEKMNSDINKEVEARKKMYRR